VDEGVLLVTNVHEGGIQSRHNFTHLTQIDISYGKTRLALLLAQLDKNLVLAQRNGYLAWGNVYY
jgi:hypothetical protein